MTLKESIESGKPFKHKKDKWTYDAPQGWMLKALDENWEVLDEPTLEQQVLDKLYKDLNK